MDQLVKTFEWRDLHKVEDDINTWLRRNPGAKVQQISHSCYSYPIVTGGNHTHYSAIILYTIQN